MLKLSLRAHLVHANNIVQLAESDHVLGGKGLVKEGLQKAGGHLRHTLEEIADDYHDHMADVDIMSETRAEWEEAQVEKLLEVYKLPFFAKMANGVAGVNESPSWQYGDGAAENAFVLFNAHKALWYAETKGDDRAIDTEHKNIFEGIFPFDERQNKLKESLQRPFSFPIPVSASKPEAK